MKTNYFKQLATLAIILILSVSAHAQWTQIGADIDGESLTDFFGNAVSISADGSVVAIGACYNDGNGINSGHVRVYKNNAGIWSQIGSDIEGEGETDFSGSSVSLSADGLVVAIGAHANKGNGDYAGHVRIYKNMAGTWTQIGSDIDGETAWDEFGWSVSLSGDGSVVAIGSKLSDGNDTWAGYVNVYQNKAGTWTQIGSDIVGEGSSDFSGYSVSLNGAGSVVAIGALKNDDNGKDAGHVRIHHNYADSWTQIGSDIDGEAAGDNFGCSVSVNADGSIVAIGSNLNDGNGKDAGHVRIYQNKEGTWSQIGSDIDGEAAGDNFGFSVSVNADGSIVAIGANLNDGNGKDAGHVRIYQNKEGTWSQIGSDIDGEAAGDNSGFSVSLSADGSVVLIGAYGNDENGSFAGHVRIYQYNTTLSTDKQ